MIITLRRSTAIITLRRNTAIITLRRRTTNLSSIDPVLTTVFPVVEDNLCNSAVLSEADRPPAVSGTRGVGTRSGREAVTVLVQRCYRGVTEVLQRCYRGVTEVLQRCDRGVTTKLYCGY